MNLDNSHSTILQETPPVVRSLAPVRRWRASDAAAIITVFVMLGVTITMFVPMNRGAGLSAFTPEHIGMFSMVETSSQRQAHRVGLVLLATLCVLGAVTITHPAAHPPAVTTGLRMVGRFLRKSSGGFLAAAAALVPLLNLNGVFPGPNGRVWRLSIWLASLCLALLGLAWCQRRKTRPHALAIWSCVTAYVFFLVIPGLARAPYLFEPRLSSAELHYSAILGAGDRLAAGLRLGPPVNLNYGLIHSLLLGVFERNWGFLNFGEHFRLVQASQIAFLVFAILAFYLWRPGNPFYVLFGALLIGPWVSTSDLAIYSPNQSGWRSFGLAAGVAALLLCRQPLGRVALILGAGACFVLLYNPETGLCLSFGYGLFLLSRQRNWTMAQMGAFALRAAAGAVMVFLAVLLFCRAGLGYWAPLGATLPFGYIRRFGQGYGGLPLYFDPLAILIFVHSAYIVSSAVLRWRVRDLEFDESLKLGISATILTWFSYYVNRPQPSTLWTCQFLYLFLIADIFEPGLLRRLRHRGIDKAIFDFRLASLAFVLIPMLLSSNYSILHATLYPAGTPAVNVTLSGISMPVDSADILQAQASFLASQEGSSTWYFTRHSYSLPLLSQRFNPLPNQDVFAETITNSDFERLVAEIYRVSPRVILFDSPKYDSVAAEKSTENLLYKLFFDRLKFRLADRYRQGQTTSGWQVWQLRLPDGISEHRVLNGK